jgi:hypothetical protein
MFLNKNSLLINGINIGQYLVEVEYGYNKVWGKDSGRNLLAEMSGTFLGVVVKLKLTFGKLTQQELELLAPILDSAWQQTTYYDPVKRQNITMGTYTGDWSTLNKTTFINHARANESFNISVIAVKPRE